MVPAKAIARRGQSIQLKRTPASKAKGDQHSGASKDPERPSKKPLAKRYTLRYNDCMDQLTNVLTAISHPTRRAIIKQLATGPARFLDVAKPFDTALNAVTKHLKLLERAGLVVRRKRGREVLISLRAEPLREVAAWVHEYERFWNECLGQFEQYFREKRKKESRR